jgi:hypothetical protein
MKIYLLAGFSLVPQGKSKKIKGKRKKDNFISFSGILNGSFISAVLYYRNPV